MKPLSIKDEIALKNFSAEKERTAFGNVYDAFVSRGVMLDDEGTAKEFSLRDLVTSQDLTRFMPQTIETIVREALEPNLFIVDRLFQGINIPRGSRIQIASVGAIEAARVGQGGEYQEKFVDITDSGEMISLVTDKHGLKISITQEVLDENLFDVVGLWLRAAGRALARHKERQAAKLINEMGYTVFDNVTPANAWVGATTGRDITGVANGSMTVNDVFEMYAYLLYRGFSPDVLLMHPLAWKTFMCDTEMREVVLANSTVASYRNPSGSAASGYGTGFGGLGLRTNATGNGVGSGNTAKGPNPWTQTLNPIGATFQIAPSYLPSALEVIVTQYVPFTADYKNTGHADSTSLSNLVMVDSSQCGVIGQGKPVTVDKWSDPERDIQNIKIYESYGFGVLEQGKGIAKAANISTARNYNFENSNARQLAELDRTVAAV